MLAILKAAALAGFLTSFALHVATIAGYSLPPFWQLLHVGIFVVFFPAVFKIEQASKGRDLSFTGLFRFLPLLPKVALAGLFLYAMVNFISSVPLDGTKLSSEGQYRLMSGHWMFFYFACYSLSLIAQSLTRSP